MKTFFAFALAILFAALPQAAATKVKEKSLEEIVGLSDNILRGEIVSVRMTDAKGQNITDPEERTGPGLENTIFLDVKVGRNLILKSTLPKLAEKISIPLRQMWHHSLGSIKELKGRKFIFLLTDEFKPADPAGF